MNLQGYTTGSFDRGASCFREACWQVIKGVFYLLPFPWPSGLRVFLLRLFGAQVGRGVVIRTGVNISFPWRLKMGDWVWLGEEVMILSLAPVSIGSHVCISQRAFLCTGSHDFSAPEFSLITRPIQIEDQCWIAAQSFIAPGVTIGKGSLVSAGSMVLKDVAPFTMVRGNPAVEVRSFV